MTFTTTIIISPQKITSQTKEDGSNKAKQVEFINSLSNYSIGGYHLIDEYTRKPTIPDFNDRKRGKVNISYE
jgi:predicted adenine nucleotide alpha hydrolase (AANH) superfamily ATPase